jgi:hypothetical protein
MKYLIFIGCAIIILGVELTLLFEGSFLVKGSQPTLIPVYASRSEPTSTFIISDKRHTMVLITASGTVYLYGKNVGHLTPSDTEDLYKSFNNITPLNR